MRKNQLTLKRITTIVLTVLSITTGEVFADDAMSTSKSLQHKLKVKPAISFSKKIMGGSR